MHNDTVILKFLANELKTNRNVVLAMHSPPAVGPWKAVKHGFTIGFNDYFNTIRPAQNQGKIKMVLASHIHAYSTQKIGGFGNPNPKGVRYIVIGRCRRSRYRYNKRTK